MGIARDQQLRGEHHSYACRSIEAREWLWHDSGSGTAMVVTGTGHRLKNIEVFHSWNASVGAENAPGLVIDGLRAHGAPNHCSSLEAQT